VRIGADHQASVVSITSSHIEGDVTLNAPVVPGSSVPVTPGGVARAADTPDVAPAVPGSTSEITTTKDVTAASEAKQQSETTAIARSAVAPDEYAKMCQAVDLLEMMLRAQDLLADKHDFIPAAAKRLHHTEAFVEHVLWLRISRRLPTNRPSKEDREKADKARPVLQAWGNAVGENGESL
jgi:hypothetical protein